MNDWGMSVLSQYPVTVRTTRKVRGALLCDTKEGLYLLSEYRGKQARLEAEAALLLYLAENGMVHTDQIIKSEKEELLSKNEEGTGYVLKMWYPWPECSVSSIGDLVQAVNSLARLHVSMRRMPKQEKVQSEESKQDMTEGNAVTNTHKERQSLACQYEKHNRELRRVRAYLHRKKKKSVLEQFIQKSLDEMYNQADIAVRAMMDGGLYEVEEQAKKEGIRPMLYSHPIGNYGHGAGPSMGMYDNQGFVPLHGELKLHNNTCYALELNITEAVPEWGGQDVCFMLEETIAYSGGDTSFMDGDRKKIIAIG